MDRRERRHGVLIERRLGRHPCQGREGKITNCVKGTLPLISAVTMSLKIKKFVEITLGRQNSAKVALTKIADGEGFLFCSGRSKIYKIVMKYFGFAEWLFLIPTYL